MTAEQQKQNNESLQILARFVEQAMSLGYFKQFSELDAARAALLDLHKAINPIPGQ